MLVEKQQEASVPKSSHRTPVVTVVAMLIGFTPGNPKISRDFLLHEVCLPTRVGDIVEVRFCDELDNKLQGYATDLLTPEDGRIVMKMRSVEGHNSPAIRLGDLPSGWRAVGSYNFNSDNPNLLITSSISA